VQVKERNPFQLSTEINNKRPPSVGPIRFEAIASDTNLTGNSDTLGLRWTYLRGHLDHLEFGETDEYSFNYALPFTASDTTLLLDYERSDIPVVERSFQNLDIASRTDSADIGIRQPIYRRPAGRAWDNAPEIDAGFSVFGGVQHNTTFLAGEPFSFSPGARNGVSRVTALRLGQDLSMRSEAYALSFRSTFNIGVDLFGATLNSNGQPDSHFLAWLGQLQYVHRLFNTDNQAIFRLTTQLTRDPLLSPEQFVVGGFDTVRGYRENQVVRDNGVVASLEFHLPIPGLRRSGDISMLELAPFIDIGEGWNVRSNSGGDPEVLSSAGVGLLAHPNRHLDFVIYYAYPFRNTGLTSDLQDIGIHFALVINAF